MWWPSLEYSTGYLNGMGYSLNEMGMLALCPMLTVAAIVTVTACGVEAEFTILYELPDSQGPVSEANEL